MLEQEGLAVTIPRKGAEVARMTEKDMEDVLQIRDALDELAASIACEQISEEELAELRHTMHEFEESTKTGDVKRIAEADVRFHDIIYHATRNVKLENMLNNLREQMYRYRVEYLKDEDFQALEKNKAVGDIASRYFDINGNIALKELDDRVVGFGLEELRETEWTSAIAVGVNKVDAIIGALRAGFMNVLYTDEKTAREILNRNLLG